MGSKPLKVLVMQTGEQVYMATFSTIELADAYFEEGAGEPYADLFEVEVDNTKTCTHVKEYHRLQLPRGSWCSILCRMSGKALDLTRTERLAGGREMFLTRLEVESYRSFGYRVTPQVMTCSLPPGRVWFVYPCGWRGRRKRDGGFEGLPCCNCGEIPAREIL